MTGGSGHQRQADVFERDHKGHPSRPVVALRPGFIFKPEPASEQRRLFAGPPAAFPTGPPRADPGGARPARASLPGAAFLRRRRGLPLAILRPVRGAFNVAAGPVVDAAALGELLGARPVKVPAGPCRSPWPPPGVSISCLPPMLVDLDLSLPAMDTARARSELDGGRSTARSTPSRPSSTACAKVPGWTPAAA